MLSCMLRFPSTQPVKVRSPSVSTSVTWLRIPQVGSVFLTVHMSLMTARDSFLISEIESLE
jgi:hypothetical protein